MGYQRALDKGADIVVCPRVTDAAVVMGPAAWRFNWERDDFDKLLLVLLLRATSLSVVVKQQEGTMLFLKKSQVLKM